MEERRDVGLRRHRVRKDLIDLLDQNAAEDAPVPDADPSTVLGVVLSLPTDERRLLRTPTRIAAPRLASLAPFGSLRSLRAGGQAL